MKKVLLDTSVIIDFVRSINKEQTLLFQLAKKGHQLCASIITHTEVYAGKSIWEKDEAREEAEKLFSGLEILPLDTKISKKAGQLRAYYTDTLIDAIIAATALYHELDLATLNVKDFKKIEHLNFFP